LEIAGYVSETPLPVYPNGFPAEIISRFEEETGRKTICNKPYSGTAVIEDYGAEHLRTRRAYRLHLGGQRVSDRGARRHCPVETLYEYCRIARKILTGRHGVGRLSRVLSPERSGALSEARKGRIFRSSRHIRCFATALRKAGLTVSR
jgi:phosphopentomutase